jgi:hypothetical protein
MRSRWRSTLVYRDQWLPRSAYARARAFEALHQSVGDKARLQVDRRVAGART